MSKTLHAILDNEEVALQILKDSPERYDIKRIQKSPCQLACPIDTRVKAYLGLIAAGEFAKAVEVVKRDNPFPGICGRVCIHPCETECERNKLDEPLAICSLKRFLADYEIKNGRVKVGKAQRKKKKQIAIIGAGPAGLTAANDLARSGYGVIVFESSSEPGGMLLSGISPFVLPKHIVRFEIEGIKDWGVEIRTGTTIGKDISLDTLQEKYDAVLITVGAHKALNPIIPGADGFSGVVNFLELQKTINGNGHPNIGESIAILGGDRAAFELARNAKRAGFDQATLLFSRSRQEMPVADSIINAAEEEGIKIYFHTRPVKVIGDKGKIIGIDCVKTEPSSNLLRRKRPTSIPESNFVIKADTYTSTVNREPELSFIQPNDSFNLSIFNTFAVDAKTLCTNINGIFAAGDCATGPKTTIEAIASGRKAARSIETYLQRVTEAPLQEEYSSNESEIITKQTGTKKRVEMSRLLPEERLNHKEVELGFSEQQAMEEAKRCLKCGPCLECDICNSDCDKRIAVLYPQGESSGSLIRVQKNAFPANNRLLNAQLAWAKNKTQPVQLEPLIASVNQYLCRGCGDCAETCYYSAPQLKELSEGVYISDINEELCRGCGTCPSVCPSSAIHISYFNDTRLEELFAECLAESNIVAFICNWSYEVSSDLERVFDLKMIRVLCSARIHPAHIVKAFEQGAKGVLGVGCYENACHYATTAETTKHYSVAKRLLQTLGIDAKKIRFERFSPDQPDKIQKAIRSFLKTIEE